MSYLIFIFLFPKITFVIDSNHKITLYQPKISGGSSNINTYNIGGGNLANVTGTGNTGFGENNLRWWCIDWSGEGISVAIRFFCTKYRTQTFMIGIPLSTIILVGPVH